MGDIKLIIPPIRYTALRDSELSIHIKYIIRSFNTGNTAEIFFGSGNTSIPCSLYQHKTKSPSLHLILRRGDFGLQNLGLMSKWLVSENYRIKVRRSAKQKTLTSVTIALDTGNIYISNQVQYILEKIRQLLQTPDNHQTGIAYYAKNDGVGLPGKKVFKHKLPELAYRSGRVIGMLIRMLFK